MNEIYLMIPDFGGFLVKANSEGEPGPQDFGRTHADGANMLGKVLKPHKGIVMWRAFVDAHDGGQQRALTGTVGPEEHAGLALLDLEADPFQDLPASGLDVKVNDL